MKIDYSLKKFLTASPMRGGIAPAKQFAMSYIPEQEYCDKRQIGRMIGVKKSKVESLMRRRKIPFIKDGISRQARVKFRISAVREAMKALETRSVGQR